MNDAQVSLTRVWYEPEEHERGLRQLLRRAPVLPLRRRTMQRFARVRGGPRRSGNIIADMDLLIAATAPEHDLTLRTRNIRHLQRITGLRLNRPPTA